MQWSSFGEIRQWVSLTNGILEIPASTLCSAVDLPHDLRQGIPPLDILEKDRQTFVRTVFCIFNSVQFNSFQIFAHMAIPSPDTRSRSILFSNKPWTEIFGRTELSASKVCLLSLLLFLFLPTLNHVLLTSWSKTFRHPMWWLKAWDKSCQDAPLSCLFLNKIKLEIMENTTQNDWINKVINLKMTFNIEGHLIYAFLTRISCLLWVRPSPAF